MSMLPLPSGLPDVLPPFAAQEFRVIYHMLKSFTAFGYQPVIPPLMEYESSLLANQGAATSRQVFRLMDPLSREMLALRADMTTQISRIAESTLSSEPRPLRLSYAGYTLRTAPEALRTRRQHTQIGIELFGASTASHDAEVIAVPVEALSNLSLSDLCLDISVPTLLESLLVGVHEEERNHVREAVSRKDTSALRTLKAGLLADIADACGPSGTALPALKALATNSPDLASAITSIEATLASLAMRGITIPTTIDILEMRGFGYYSGIAFSLFLRNPAIEIGRGGHYTTDTGEEAVGFTFYIDDILAAIGDPTPRMTLGVGGDMPLHTLRGWQEQGYETVLLHSSTPQAEAKALGCTHLLVDGNIKTLN